MASSPPRSNSANGGALFISTSDVVSAFRTMLTHISELLTPDDARSLAYINGLPSPSNNAPHKPLDVLMELEKRGVFSHEHVDHLIGLLTDLHRVDIINTCQVREYKEKAELARSLPRGDSFSSMNARHSAFASSSHPQSIDVTEGDQKTPAHNHPSPLTTAPPLKAQSSSSSSVESLPVSMTTTTPTTNLTKAELITSLACDPEARSLMRQALTTSTKGEPTNSGVDATSQPQTLDLRDDLASLVNKDEILRPSDVSTAGGSFPFSTSPTAGGNVDDLASPPIEYKSIDPSLYRQLHRQTSSTSTQTEEALSLPLGQGGVTESVASSRETGSTSGYDSIPLSSLTQGFSELTGTTSPDINSPTPQNSQTNDREAGAAAAVASPSRPALDFNPAVESTKIMWKVKRLTLCDYICKHSSKVITKDVKLSTSSSGSSRRQRNLGRRCDYVKLVFQLCPYGIGKDESSFMSMRVCVHLDQRCAPLRDMATLHLKITASLPPTDFVTVKTASNALEDFVINDFIPFDVVINSNAKNVEFKIEAYMNFDHHVQRDLSFEQERELMNSLKPLDDNHHGDDDEDQFVDLGYRN